MEISYPIYKEDVECLATCPACGSDDLFDVSSVENKEGLSFLVTAYCNNCSFVFRSTRPTKKWFSDAFIAREQYQQNQKFEHINLLTEKHRYERYLSVGNEIKKLIAKNVEQPRVLDVACGTGTGLKAFEELGFETYGIDEDRTRALYGISNGLRIDIITWEKYEPSQKFEVITILHALEHFHDPVSFLDKVKAWLSPGGIIIIEVPDFKNFHPNWTDSLYLAHMSNFDENSLALMAAKCQLESISRLMHYDSVEDNNANLCMGFRALEIPSDSNKKGHENITLDLVKNRYRNDLGFALNEAQTIKYQVKCINDISLTYKSDLNVDSDLSKNMMKKKLNYNSHLGRIEVI